MNKSITDLSSLLCVNCFSDLESSTKHDALAELCSLTAKLPTVSDPDRLLEDILSRERVMSTGIGGGIAIPHARTSAVDDFVIAVGRSRAGIEFESLDSLPVHIVILMGAPEKKRNEFLTLIASIGRMFNRPEVVTACLEATGPDEIMALFLEYFSKTA